MPAPVRLAHSQTVSMRLSSGAEALVVRVLTREGVAGYGFTFSADVAAARAMACWDAAARTAGRPLWQLLREARPEARAALEAGGDDAAHPWVASWRSALDAARDLPGTHPPSTPGCGVDWTLEPGFIKLRWIDPESNVRERHGPTPDAGAGPGSVAGDSG